MAVRSREPFIIFVRYIQVYCTLYCQSLLTPIWVHHCRLSQAEKLNCLDGGESHRALRASQILPQIIQDYIFGLLLPRDEPLLVTCSFRGVFIFGCREVHSCEVLGLKVLHNFIGFL